MLLALQNPTPPPLPVVFSERWLLLLSSLYVCRRDVLYVICWFSEVRESPQYEGNRSPMSGTPKNRFHEAQAESPK